MRQVWQVYIRNTDGTNIASVEVLPDSLLGFLEERKHKYYHNGAYRPVVNRAIYVTPGEIVLTIEERSEVDESFPE